MPFIVLAVLLLAAAAYLLGEAVTAPARERQVSVRRAATYGKFRAALGERDQPFRDRVLEPAKGRLAGVGLVLGAMLGGAVSGGVGVVVFGLAIGGIGFIGPDFVVSSRARKRRESIKAQLPDALDLLAVSVEAGLGFDGAISKLTEHMEGPLPEEFGLTLNEIRIGESRQTALKNMGERVGAPELSAFVRAVVQAEQLGISLGRILRVQAADSRLRRQAAAEEKAMKAPIKMLFPTVIFIFPSMFLVILGPALMNLGKLF